MLLAITVNSQYSNMKNRLLRQQIEIWIETCSEQTANQNTNIAWQYCKVARKRTTGFTVNNYVGGFIQLSRVLLTSIGGGGGFGSARARGAREEGDISLSLHAKNYPFPFPFQSLPCRLARQALKMEEETEKWDVHCILTHAPVFTIFLHKLTLSGTWLLFFFPVRHNSNSMTASLFQAFR